MLKTALVGLALFLSLNQVGAASGAGTLTFAGDPLVAKYNSLGAQGGLIEFVPPNETIDGWTRLVGYPALLDSGQNAADAAAALARQARRRYPGAEVTTYGRRAESIVEFSLVTSDGTIEYNVFRYAVGPGGHGLVSLQYARRLRGRDANMRPEQAPPLGGGDRAVRYEPRARRIRGVAVIREPSIAHSPRPSGRRSPREPS